eukprot:scaffold291143_cov67-Attheya_sp.AAC.1
MSGELVTTINFSSENCYLDNSLDAEGHDTPGESGTRTKRELLGAGNGRQAPITIKVAFLGSMLGPSVLFNTGYRHGTNGDGKEPRNSRLGYAKKECYDSLHGVEMWRVKHRKSKKCNDKATDMAQTSIMDTNHNTEQISVMHWFIKANKKGVRRTARLVAILGGMNTGCEVRFVKFMRRLLKPRV